MTTYVYYDPNQIPPASAGYILRVTENADGSWSSPTAVSIDGSTSNPFVDPNILILPDGTYLLAYTTLLPGSGGQPAQGVAINTAISTDGINFTSSQPAFTLPSTGQASDPSIVQLDNGSFLMSVGNFTTLHGVIFYSSSDGRNFTPTGVTLAQSELAPDLLVLPNGDVRLFTGTLGGIGSYISTNNGQTWTLEAGLRLELPNQAGIREAGRFLAMGNGLSGINQSQWTE